MSSNAINIKAPTGSGSTIMSIMKGKAGIFGFTILGVGLFIGSFVSMSNFVGSKDDWNVIQPQITRILVLTLVGTFALIGAALLYYIQDPDKVIYFMLVVVCLSLGLSFSALATAVISR